MAPKKPGMIGENTLVIEPSVMQFNEDSLPRVINARVKKTGEKVTVSKKYFLDNQCELEIV